MKRETVKWEAAQDNDIKNIQRPAVPPIWHQLTEREDAIDAIRMVLECFPNLKPTGMVTTVIFHIFGAGG